MSGIFGGGSKPNISSEQKLSGVNLQTSAYGAPMGLYYGTNRAAGNVIWYGDFNAIEHQTSTSSGGKGGGGGSTSISYTYKTSFMLALGEGEVTITGVMPNNEGFKTPSALGFELHSGALGQATWGTLTSLHPAQAINYSGVAHMDVPGYDLGSQADLPNFSVKLTGQPGITTNLALYLQHFLTNGVCGVGFQSSRLSGFTALDAYLAGQSVSFSPYAVEQKQAADYLTEWVAMANAEMLWSGGILSFLPRYDTAGIVANLTPDDFIVDGDAPPVTMTRTDNQDAYNQLQIQYLDMANDFNSSVVDHKDQANIDKFGLRPASTETYNAIKTAAVASWVAEHRLKRKLYVRNQFKFKLSLAFDRLEPMDVVTLTDPILGLSAEPVRIIEITDNGDTREFLAEEYDGLVSGVVTTTPAPVPVGGGIDQGVAPGSVNAPVIFQPPVALIPYKPEIWMAVSGGADYGGCEVWASLDNASYKRIGIINGSHRHGTITAALATGSATDITNIVHASIFQGQLLPGTTQDAVDRTTLCWIDGEMLAYRDSTLISTGHYDLGYLVRGAYGTTIGAHAINSKFARVDESIFRYEIPAEWYGRTIYIKLPAFNKFGLSSESLASVTAYTHVITATPPAALTMGAGSSFQTTNFINWTAPADPSIYSRIDILRSTTTPGNIANAVVIAAVSPNVATYSDPVGVSGQACYYWIRAVSMHGEVGTLSSMVTLTTGTVGGIPIYATVPSTHLEDVIYVQAGESLYEWQTTAYVKSQPTVAANKILAGTVTAAVSMTSAEIIGGTVHGGGFTSTWGWPASGLTGFLLHSNGLRLGNLNDGKYAVIESNGQFDFTAAGGAYLRSDGTNITHQGLARIGGVRAFETVGTASFTIPVGITDIYLPLIVGGGGGGSGRSSADDASAGVSGGTTTVSIYRGASLIYTLNAPGGAGGTGYNGTGVAAGGTMLGITADSGSALFGVIAGKNVFVGGRGGSSSTGKGGSGTASNAQGFGAGGGGADDFSRNTQGSGGGAGAEALWVKIPGVQKGDVVYVTIGAGGTPGSGSRAGGYGRSGKVVVVY